MSRAPDTNAMEALRELVDALSHDVLSPMRGCREVASWLVVEPSDTPQSREAARVLLRRTERLVDIVEALVGYGRLERCLADPIERVDLRVLIEQMVVERTLPSGFVVRIDPALPVVMTRAAPLRETLRNLLDNAVVHRATARGRIDITARECGGAWLELEVADDGPGIPVRFQSELFKPLRTYSPHGTVFLGMGLTVAKRLVELHGGEIRLDSTPGSGTRVLFTWPKALDGV